MLEWGTSGSTVRVPPLGPTDGRTCSQNNPQGEKPNRLPVATFQSGFWRERPALWCAGAALRAPGCAGVELPAACAQNCRPRAQARTHHSGARTWRPRLGLAWVSCGLGVVKTAANVHGMATWVFCNRCFQPPRRTVCFSLTSCGHVYCTGCLSKCGWGHGAAVWSGGRDRPLCVGLTWGSPQAKGQAHRSSEEHVPKTETKGQ